jgi:hypothetical protein
VGFRLNQLEAGVPTISGQRSANCGRIPVTTRQPVLSAFRFAVVADRQGLQTRWMDPKPSAALTMP